MLRRAIRPWHFLVNVWDVLGARVVAAQGATAIATASWAVSASFGKPDLTRANRLVTWFEPAEEVAGGVGEVGVEGESLAVDLDGR
jgi:2-methylisocitrate lyase-like PEP mutase family enzyme